MSSTLFLCSRCDRPNVNGNRQHVGTCTTCPDGDALCDICCARHTNDPRYAQHAFLLVVVEDPGLLLLARLQLTPAAKTCVSHGGLPFTGLTCVDCSGTSHTPGLCAECLNQHSSLHPGHVLVSARSSAPLLRTRLREAALSEEGETVPVVATDSIMATASTRLLKEFVQEPPLVACARRKAVAVQDELATLEHVEREALLQLEVNRDAAMAVVHEANKERVSNILAVSATKRAELQTELVAANAALKGALSVTLEVSEALATNENPLARLSSLLERSISARVAVAATPILPVTNSCISMSGATADVLQDAVSCAMGHVRLVPLVSPTHPQSPHCATDLNSVDAPSADVSPIYAPSERQELQTELVADNAALKGAPSVSLEVSEALATNENPLAGSSSLLERSISARVAVAATPILPVTNSCISMSGATADVLQDTVSCAMGHERLVPLVSPTHPQSPHCATDLNSVDAPSADVSPIYSPSEGREDVKTAIASAFTANLIEMRAHDLPVAPTAIIAAPNVSNFTSVRTQLFEAAFGRVEGCYVSTRVILDTAEQPEQCPTPQCDSKTTQHISNQRTSPLVLCARHKALAAATELVVLDEQTQIALAKHQGSCDAVVAALLARFEFQTSAVLLTAESKRMKLMAERATADMALEGVLSTIGDVLQAAQVLDDVDIIAHAQTFLARTDAAKEAVATIPVLPNESAYIAVTSAELEILRNVVLGVLSLLPPAPLPHFHTPHCAHAALAVLNDMCPTTVMVEILRSFVDVVEVAQVSCSKLTHVAHTEMRAFIETGGTAAVCSALITHESVGAVAEYGCSTLANLASDSSEAVLAIVDAGGVAAISKVVLSHLAVAEIALVGCRALASISVLPLGQHAIIEADGVSVIVEILRAHCSVAEIIQLCFHCLRRMASINAGLQSIVVNGGMSATLSVIQDGSADVAIWGCELIFLMASNSREALQAFMDKNGAIAIVQALRIHASNKDIAQCGFRVIIIISAFPSGKQAIVDAGAMNVIKELLNSHKNVSEVVTGGCRAIASIANNFNAGQRAAVDTDVPSTIVTIMRENIYIAEIVRSSCAALVDISALPTGLEATIAAGAPAVSISILLLHRDNAPVAQDALHLLDMMVSVLSGKHAIIDGGVAHIITVLQSYAEHFTIATAGCRILRGVAATGQRGQQAIVDAGGIAVIIAILFANLRSEDVVREAFMALSGLDCREFAHKQAAAAFFGAAGCRAVVSVLSIHGDDVDIAVNACRVLTSFSSVSNLSLVTAEPMATTAMPAAKAPAKAVTTVDSESDLATAMRKVASKPAAKGTGFEGVASAVVTVLRKHSGTTAALQAACQALSTMETVAVCKAGGVDVLVGILRSQVSRGDSVTYACAILGSMAYNHDAQRTFVGTDGVAAVVQILRVHAGDSDVVKEGLQLLVVIASGKHSIAVKESIFNVGGISVISEALRIHGHEPARRCPSSTLLSRKTCGCCVAEPGLRLLISFISDKCLVSKLSEVQEVMTVAIMAISKSHAAFSNVLSTCFRTLRATFELPTGQQAAINNGVPAIIVAGLCAHTKCAVLAAAGCHTLENLVKISTGQKAAIAAGAPAALVAVLRAHPGDDAVLCSAFGVLGYVTRSAEGIKASVDAGAVAATAESLHVTSTHASRGCWALKNMTALMVGKKSAADARAPAAIVRALLANPSDAELAQWGCDALASITAGCDRGKKSAVNACAPAAVVAALCAHSDKMIVNHHACRTLANIAAGFPAGQQAAIDAGAPAALMNAVRLHAGTDVVQHGCRALANIAALPAGQAIKAGDEAIVG